MIADELLTVLLRVLGGLALFLYGRGLLMTNVRTVAGIQSTLFAVAIYVKPGDRRAHWHRSDRCSDIFVGDYHPRNRVGQRWPLDRHGGRRSGPGFEHRDDGIQSSSATMGITISLASQCRASLIIWRPKKTMPAARSTPPTRRAPTLIAALGRSRSALSIGLFHTLFNIFTALAGIALVRPFLGIVAAVSGGANAGRQIANAQLLFNLLGRFAGVAFPWADYQRTQPSHFREHGPRLNGAARFESEAERKPDTHLNFLLRIDFVLRRFAQMGGRKGSTSPAGL